MGNFIFFSRAPWVKHAFTMGKIDHKVKGQKLKRETIREKIKIEARKNKKIKKS